MGEDRYTNYFIARLKERLQNNQHFVILIVGRPGSGKSYTSLRIAELVDPGFSLDKLVYTPIEFIKLVKNEKEGSVIIFDEAGTGIFSREWHQKINIAFAKLFQILRYKRFGIILNAPLIHFLDRVVRLLFDYILLIEGYNKEKKITYCKPFVNPTMNFVLGTETLYPFVISENGKNVEVSYLYFSKPRLAEEYEKLAQQRKNELIEALEKEIADTEKRKEIEDLENRSIKEFVEKCVVLDTKNFEHAGVIYKRYADFCFANCLQPEQYRDFFKKLKKEIPIVFKRDGHNVLVLGIKLKDGAMN